MLYILPFAFRNALLGLNVFFFLNCLQVSPSYSKSHNTTCIISLFIDKNILVFFFTFCVCVQISSHVIPIHHLWSRRNVLSLSQNRDHLTVFVQHPWHSPLPTSCQLPLPPSHVSVVTLSLVSVVMPPSLVPVEPQRSLIRVPVALQIQQHPWLSPVPTSHQVLIIITPCSLPDCLLNSATSPSDTGYLCFTFYFFICINK